MNRRLIGALLAWGSVQLAPTPLASQEARTHHPFEIIAPNDADGSIDVLLPSGKSMDDLGKMTPSSDKLAAAFRVYVEAAGAASPMAGSLQVLEDRFRFKPRFPFLQGTKYAVSFDAHCIVESAVSSCALKSDPDAVFEIEISSTSPRTSVVEVHPKAERLPANLLRFHISFSQPMAQGDVYEHVSLTRADGSAVPSPFLNLSTGLWGREQKRLTILFDPGRIKRGVGPNLEAGPPLATGETYVLRIDPGLRDASGRRMSEAFEKEFTVIEPVRGRLDPQKWEITVPEAGSRQPLFVVTEAHIDSGSLDRAIAILGSGDERITGALMPASPGPGWQFVPDRAWREGTYRIKLHEGLEDISGNSVRAAFDAINGSSLSIDEEHLSLIFEVRPTVQEDELGAPQTGGQVDVGR